MVVFFVRGIAAGAAVRRNVYLAADDGFDARFGGFLVELDGAVHHAVVGYCQGRHAQFFSPRNQLRDAAHAI